MRRVVPLDPGLINSSHVWLGLALAVFGSVYFIALLADGRGRELFPWVVGHFKPLWTDVAGLARGRVPAAGGAGLYSIIQGLLMVALLAAAWTGVAWWWSDGSRASLELRQWHQWAAQGFGVLLVLHAIAVVTHLLDFIRD